MCLLLPLFYQGAQASTADSTPALFFGLILSYIIPVFSYITEKSRDSLDELRPILDLEEADFLDVRYKIDHTSRTKMLLVLLLGAVAGFSHMTLIRGSASEAINEMFASLPGFLSTIGAMMVWMVMTTVIGMLIRQTSIFGRLASYHSSISLFKQEEMYPFVRVAITSSLAVIGALACFPLIGIERGQHFDESVPGVLALLVPLAIIFFIPIWPVHRRLTALKRRELDRIDKEFDALGARGEVTPLDLAAPGQQAALSLLKYRQIITRVSTWPINIGNLTRFVLYLVIVPLTWAGAAMIEILIDSFL